MFLLSDNEKIVTIGCGLNKFFSSDKNVTNSNVFKKIVYLPEELKDFLWSFHFKGVYIFPYFIENYTFLFYQVETYLQYNELYFLNIFHINSSIYNNLLNVLRVNTTLNTS